MFLQIDGLKLPGWSSPHTVYLQGNEWQGIKPSWVVQLGETFWDVSVKNKIAGIYKRVGIPDPMRQKLVEPFAACFGGKNKEGVPDLSKVNWEALVDFFEWEAASISENRKESERLQAKAEKKYGGGFFHYDVYQDFSSPRAIGSL